MRRVVVSGIGAVTPLGLTFESSWHALLRNRSGIVPLSQSFHHPLSAADREQVEQIPCQVAAPVSQFPPESERTTARFVQFALKASRDAVAQASLDTASVDSERMGVSIGSGMSGVWEIVNTARQVEQKNSLRAMSPYFVPKVLVNSASGRVAMDLGARGPNLGASTACAAGTHALGDAFRCIQTGMADIMLAGGTESCIDPLSIAGFSRLRALSTGYNDDPESASRPFDKHRDGFVMGEGSCVFVLEEIEHARRRSRTGVAVELVGYGAAGDAHHATSPDPEGKGAIRAMRMALNEAKLDIVDYVNAHATSTPKGDDIEACAIGQIFRQHQSPFVSSTKGATGHLLGAAGAIESGFAIQALIDQIVPHTRNLNSPTSVDGVQFVRTKPLQVATLETAINNSFGFGGTNACLVFRRVQL